LIFFSIFSSVNIQVTGYVNALLPKERNLLNTWKNIKLELAKVAPLFVSVGSILMWFQLDCMQ